jgi:small subunit ribosomal protein S6
VRSYETTVILRPTLSAAEVEDHVAALKGLIEAEAEVLRSDVWGRRKLAYPIQGHSEGVYAYFAFRGKADLLTELVRRYQINENVIRYLTVRCDRPLEQMPTTSLDDAPEASDRRGASDRGPQRRRVRARRDEDQEDEKERAEE